MNNSVCTTTFIISCLFFVHALEVNGQSSWPVPKPKDPYYSDKPLTLGKNELIHAGKLSSFYFRAVNFDSTQYQIISYRVSIFGKGRNPDLDMESHTDSIPARILDRIKSCNIGDQVFFEYVLGMQLNSENKKRGMPPLSVTIMGD